MQSEPTGQECQAPLIDNTRQATKKAGSSDEQEYIGVTKNKAAARMGKTGSVSQPERVRLQWLREIAKRAASARWTRGD